MKEKKLETIQKLLGSNKVRGIWDEETKEIYFPVVDVIKALANTKNPYYCWKMLKEQLLDEGCDLSSIIRYTKLKAPNGKYHNVELCDMEGMFRIAMEIPSKKAERVKQWLANSGKQRIDEISNPDLLIEQVIEYYREKGYSEERINDIFDKTLKRKLMCVKTFKGEKSLYQCFCLNLDSININDLISLVETINLSKLEGK